MHPGGPTASGIVPTVREDAYTAAKHTRRGRQVVRDLARGREAHVFEDSVDLGLLENSVWAQGIFQGRVGTGSRGAFDRFVWRSPTRMGSRVQAGKPDVPLFWVEIKGKMDRGVWRYHLVPRARPATP